MDISPGFVDYIPAEIIYPTLDVGMNIIPVGNICATRNVGMIFSCGPVDYIPAGEI